MKKVAAIFLVFLYLIPSIGFSMDLHFCGSSVTNLSIQKKLDKDCICAKKSAKNCCKEIHLEVKLDVSQKAASTLEVSKKVSEIKLFINNIFSSELFTSSSQKNSFIYYDPLRSSSLQKHPVYLTNSLLLL